MPLPLRRAFTRTDLLIALPILFLSLFLTIVFTGCATAPRRLTSSAPIFNPSRRGWRPIKPILATTRETPR